MRLLDHLQTRILAILALLAVFAATTVVSPYLPHSTLHAQQVGPGGVPGAGGGGAVASVFGRTGAVVAANGDYTVSQVTNAAATNAANVFSEYQTAPSWEFTGSHNWQWFGDPSLGAAYLRDITNSANVFGVFTYTNSPTADGPEILSDYCYVFSVSITEVGGAGDTGICRPSANIITFGDGEPNDTSAWVQFAAMGNGVSGNTDLRGHLTATTSAFSYTFTETYAVAPTCVLNDTTAHNVPTFTASTTTLSGTTTGATDNVNYVCAD